MTICWRLRPRLILIALLSLHLLAQASVASFDTAGQTVVQDGTHSDQLYRPGDEEVREAIPILERLRPRMRRVSRFTKPSGPLGSAMYYAREASLLLFMSGPSHAADSDSYTSRRKLSAPLVKAVNLLELAAEKTNPDAIYLLADMKFYGKYSHPRNFSQAFEGYQQLADLTGNSTAQHMLGFIFATGIGNVVEKDQAKALLYHTFAADAGEIRSQMTVAYRHYAGIATVRNCERGVHYYKQVADKAMRHVRSGPPGGQYPIKEAYRLADDEGGVYGEGASVSSSGSNARHGGPNTDANAGLDNVLEYLDLMSRQGQLKATFGLGKMHYEGSRALKQDFHTARDYFLDVARRYWTKDGKIKPDTEPGVDKLASKAAGYLGRMFLRGEGMAQNFAKARVWFRRGVENGDPICQYSLGLMHLHGLGVQQNSVKAAELFAPAADQDFSAAQVRLGALLLDQGDIPTATKYFELAARNGHMEAFYFLAELHNNEPGRDCNLAASFYKIVSEKAETIHSSFPEANEAYEDGDYETAITLYMMAAEQGYETAQANVAYLIDKPQRRSLLDRFLPSMRRKATALLDDAALALIYWTRSAKQTNIDSLVKMGDYYLFGLGTTDSQPDAEKAAACYQAAAETLQSAQAMWNLGWMHENGIGIEQDFHLAKRFYDQSRETNKEAYVPVTLALIKLRARSCWNWITGGSVNPIRDESGSSKRYSLQEWFATFLEADLENINAQLEKDDAAVGADEWDSGPTAGTVQGEELYGGGDDFFDDDGTIETLVILGLAAALVLLVFWRQQRQLQFRRAEGQPPPPQQHQQDNRPDNNNARPGGPEFHEWVAGAIGP